MKGHHQAAHPDQLGFDLLLAETDATNQKAALEKTYGHLPATMEKALPLYRGLIDEHHAAMLAGDIDQAMALRRTAHDLALRLNNGEPGILAGPDAPGCKLAELTAALEDEVPLWGQEGSFVVSLPTVRVFIKMDGIFGIGASVSPWMNFAAHAIDWDKPFINETGYRSFMGLHAAVVPSLTPDAFARLVLEAHIKRELKNQLRAIDPRYRPEDV